MHYVEEEDRGTLKWKRYIFENKYGFTSGGKTEHCLFIIDYITNMTYESSKIILYSLPL